MIEVRQTTIFRNWLDGLHDQRAQSRIAVIECGLLGDEKFFDGIGEIRIDYGPGFRVYFVQRGVQVIILMCGGDKSSQNRDIRRAKQIAEELED